MASGLGAGRSPSLWTPVPAFRTLSIQVWRGDRKAGPERAEPGPRPLKGPQNGSRDRDEAMRTWRRSPGVPLQTKEALGFGAQRSGPPSLPPLPSLPPCWRNRARARCGKGEEVNSSCHCIGRGWKEHMFYGERPRPPLPRLLKPETTSSPRVLFPAPHQVVVLHIIAHEIILHVRHLGWDGGRGEEKLETTSSHNPPRLRGVTPSFSPSRRS